MAVTLVAIFAVAGCNDYGNTFQSPGGATLIFLSPSQIPASTCTGTPSQSCPSFTLKINGFGFVPQTKVQWNGKTCPLSSSSGAATAPCVTYITLDSSNNVTELTATVTAALYAKAGTATVNTINPNSNYGTGTNGLSNALTFIIDNPANPAPTVTSVAPACVVTGNSLAITVAGTNFMNLPASSDPTGTQFSTLNWTLGSSQLQLTPNTTNPAMITATQITATIPATSVTTAGNATITVSNPPSTPVPGVPGSTGSGGGTSTITPLTTVTVEPATGSCPAAANGQSASAKAAAVAEETPAVSVDGRYVAYTAIEGEHAQIFLRDTCEGAATGCQPHTSLLSVTSDGRPAAGDNHTPSMSSDGRYVAFSSEATNLIENAPSGRQVYLRDTCARADASCKASTILVSTDSSGALAGTESILPSISSSGRFVAFVAVTPSRAPNHPPAEAKSSTSALNSGLRQVFVRDTCLGFRPPQFLLGFGVRLREDAATGVTTCTPRTTRISLEPGDGTGSDRSPAGPALSGKATHVALPGAKASTLFTRSVPVDDRVFLAITGDER